MSDCICMGQLFGWGLGYMCPVHRPALALVTPAKRCIVHDETFTNVCRGCRADEIAADGETA